MKKKQTNKQKQKPCGWRSNIGNDYDVFRGLGPGACLSKVPIAFRAQKPGVMRVSMGLTDRRKTAKNLVDSRKN